MARSREDDCDSDSVSYAAKVKTDTIYDRFDAVTVKLNDALRRLAELQEAVDALRERVG